MKRSPSMTAGALLVAGLMAAGTVSGAGRAAASGGTTLVPGPCVSLVVQPPPYGVTISTSEFKLNAKLTSCSADTQTDLVVAYGTTLVPIQDETAPGGWPTMLARCVAPQTSTTGVLSSFTLSPGASVTVACNLFLLSYSDLETGVGAVYGNAVTGNNVNNDNPRFYSADGINPPVLLATSDQFTWFITEVPTGGGRRKG